MKKEGDEVLQVQEQIFPAACGEDHARADIHTAASGGPHAAAGGYALKEAAAHGEHMQKQVFWQELQSVGDPHWSSLFLKDCSLCSTLEQGKSVRRKEQQRGTVMN